VLRLSAVPENQHTLPVGFNGGGYYRKFLMRVEKEQPIPRRFLRSAVSILSLISRSRLAGTPDFASSPVLNNPPGKHAAGNGMVLYVGEGQFQAGVRLERTGRGYAPGHAE